MDPEKLIITIIYGNGEAFCPLPELMNRLPQITIAEESYEALEFLNRPDGHNGLTPDTIVVYLDGMPTPPEWIEDLSQKFPSSPVLVCSGNRGMEFLTRAMQMGVRDILPIPLRQSEMVAALERVRLAKQRVSNSTQKSVVVVVAGLKGGVGATTIAINLAVALSELQGKRTFLMDLGRPFADIGNFLDLECTYDICDVFHNLDSLDESFFKKVVQPCGTNLDILHGISAFKETDDINLEDIGKIFTILRSLYKYIVVDIGHLFDELFFRMYKEADLVLMLTELNVPNYLNLERFWTMLKEYDPSQKKVKFVVNRYDKYNALGMRQLEKILGESPYSILPSDYFPLNEAINLGLPLVKMNSNSKLYRGLNDMARKIISSDSSEENSLNNSNHRRRFWFG